MSDESQHTILVVEDNSDSREMLCSALRHKGYNVIEAENGKYAILEASRNHPDLIVMDLAMPEMDGVEAARRILQVPKLSSIPIFVVSAYAIDDVKAEAISVGCAEIFEKPVDVESLLKKIKGTLSGKPFPQTQRREVERVKVSIPAKWGLTPQCPHDGTITSLSIRGCLIQTDSMEVLSQKTIFLRFQLPSGEWIQLRGGVLYYLKRVVFGMEFKELSDESTSMLKQLVEHYSKKST